MQLKFQAKGLKSCIPAIITGVFLKSHWNLNQQPHQYCSRWP